MARKHARDETEILEHGDIFFVYRPDVEQDEPNSPDDVQRLYLALRPVEEKKIRLIALGKKSLPEVGDGGRSYWGFVSRVVRKPGDLEEEIAGKTYQTKTRGERHQPPARPAGEGVYAVARHGDHTHLAYVLEAPGDIGPVQRAFHIEPEASYILSIKNPEQSSPPGTGLSEDRQPKFPKKLQQRFRGRKFVPASPSKFLNYEGAELVLVAASDDIDEDLGLDLHTEHEDERSAEVFEELRMDRSRRNLEPLFEGQWA